MVTDESLDRLQTELHALKEQIEAPRRARHSLTELEAAVGRDAIRDRRLQQRERELHDEMRRNGAQPITDGAGNVYGWVDPEGRIIR